MQSVFKDRGRLKALCDERRRTFWDKSLLSEGGSSYSKPNTDRDSNLPKCSLHSLCIVKNILSVYNVFVSGQLYRESATTNNVYKRDPNEENWWKGNMTDILLRDFVKFCAETRGGRRSDTGLAVPLLMTPKDTHSGWTWIDIYLTSESSVNEYYALPQRRSSSDDLKW